MKGRQKEKKRKEKYGVGRREEEWKRGESGKRKRGGEGKEKNCNARETVEGAFLLVCLANMARLSFAFLTLNYLPRFFFSTKELPAELMTFQSLD